MILKNDCFFALGFEDTKNITVSKREVKVNKMFIVKYINICKLLQGLTISLLINCLFLLIFVSFFERGPSVKKRYTSRK